MPDKPSTINFLLTSENQGPEGRQEVTTGRCTRLAVFGECKWKVDGDAVAGTEMLRQIALIRLECGAFASGCGVDMPQMVLQVGKNEMGRIAVITRRGIPHGPYAPDSRSNSLPAFPL